MLAPHVDDKNYARTCHYLVSLCHYLPEPDDTAVLQTAHAIYLKMAKARRYPSRAETLETLTALTALTPATT